jgi:hypothetical protein
MSTIGPVSLLGLHHRHGFWPRSNGGGCIATMHLRDRGQMRGECQVHPPSAAIAAVTLKTKDWMRG